MVFNAFSRAAAFNEQRTAKVAKVAKERKDFKNYLGLLYSVTESELKPATLYSVEDVLREPVMCRLDSSQEPYLTGS